MAVVGTEVAVDTAAAVAAVVVVVAAGAAVLAGDWADENNCSLPGYPVECGEQTEDQMEGQVVLGLVVSASVDQMEAHRGLTVETE